MFSYPSQIDNACLVNAIPSSFQQLRNLTTLIVSDSPRCTELKLNPTTIDGADQLPKLERLEVAVWNLAGFIPLDFGWSGSPLRILTLKSTGLPSESFIGQIPESFINLTCLEELHLENLGMSQGASEPPLPLSLKKLSLVNMKSYNAQLTPYFSTDCNVTHLDVSNSPVWIGIPTCRRLEYLDISHVEDTHWELDDLFWTQFPKLRHFAAAGTRTYGSISSSIQKMPDLEHLDLSQTDIHGSLPPEIGLTALKFLNLSKSNLQTPLSPGLASLNSTLQVLSLMGIKSRPSPLQLPEWLSSFSKLEMLHLDSCNLYGTIPPSYGTLRYLRSITMINNRLNGTIPDVSWPKGFHLDFSSNNLTGSIPESVTQRARSL